MNTKVLFSIFLCLMAVGSGQGGTLPVDPAVFWKPVIQRGSLSEIAATFAAPDTPRWPNSDNPTTNDKEVSQLVRLLHEKLRAEVSKQTTVSLDAVKACSAIAGGLQSSGGYTNILLADSFCRVALFQTSKWLVEGGRPLSEVKEFTAAIPTYAVTLPNVLEALANRDKSIAIRSDALAAITSSETLYAAANKLGPEAEGSLAKSLRADEQTFTRLSTNPSVFGLTVRLARTEMFHRVSLGALITFLERGGTRDELDPADITAFKNRMQGLMKTFGYSPLGLKSLSVENPLSVFELHTDPAKSKKFLKIALD